MNARKTIAKSDKRALAVREAIREVLEPNNVAAGALNASLENDVYGRGKHPGGWAPAAVAVVSCENGSWESPLRSRFWAEKWDTIVAALHAKGFKFRLSPVNDAIVAFYAD